MEEPIISVIIPAYNVESCICRCLESVKRQSFLNFEAIIVDDGSTDNSFGIAEKYSQTDKRFKVVSQSNRGQGSARNHGMDLARGAYLAFVDSDDWIHEDYLNKLYSAIQNYDADIAVCNAERVWDTGRKKYNNGIFRKSEVITNAVEYLPGASMSVWDKLYRASIFEGLRFPENMKFEDLALMPQVIIRAQKIAVIEDSLYYYFWRDGSTTNQKKVSRDILKAQHILEDSAIKEKCPEILQKLFVKNVMGSLIWGILKEENPYDEAAEIMNEGIEKYPELTACDLGALMGKSKKIYGYYLLHGKFKRARRYVLAYERMSAALKRINI